MLLISSNECVSQGGKWKAIHLLRSSPTVGVAEYGEKSVLSFGRQVRTEGGDWRIPAKASSTATKGIDARKRKEGRGGKRSYRLLPPLNTAILVATQSRAPAACLQCFNSRCERMQSRSILETRV